MRAAWRGAVLGALSLAGTLLAGLPAAAVQPDEILPDRDLEHRARGLSAEFRCLVCQNQSIDDSDAPLARDLRLLVRERLRAGDTDAGVRDFVVRRYGQFVLLRPAFGVPTLVLWLGPFLIVLTAVGGLILARRRRDERPAEPLSGDEERRLAALLGEGRG